MKPLRTFRNLREVDQLVQALTRFQSEARRLCRDTSGEMPSAAAKLVLNELNCLLSVEATEAARATVPKEELAAAQRDARVLLPIVRPFCEAGLSVDLETLDDLGILKKADGKG